MVAGILAASHRAINANVFQSALDRLAEQHMVKPPSGIALPGIPHIIPEGVNALIEMPAAQRIGPAIALQSLERLARGGLEQGHPKAMAFLERIHARPAYARALEKGGPYVVGR